MDIGKLNVRQVIEKMKYGRLESTVFIYLFAIVVLTFLTPLSVILAIKIREVLSVEGTAIFLGVLAMIPPIVMTILSKASIGEKIKVLVVSLIVIVVITIVGFNFLRFIRPYLHM